MDSIFQVDRFETQYEYFLNILSRSGLYTEKLEIKYARVLNEIILMSDTYRNGLELIMNIIRYCSYTLKEILKIIDKNFMGNNWKYRYSIKLLMRSVFFLIPNISDRSEVYINMENEEYLSDIDYYLRIGTFC